jgi:hypothetical protein
MQTLIVDALQGSRVPLTTAELRKRYELESWDYYKLDWKRRRSVRMSMGRALRQLDGWRD